MSSRSALSAVLAFAAVLAAGACGGDGSTPTQPVPADGIQLVSTGPASDTVDATPGELLTVTYFAGGKPAAGTKLKFEGVLVPSPACGGQCSIPSMLTAPASSGAFDVSLVGVVDVNGRSSVRIRFGALAGTGYVRVSVLGTDTAKTVTYTVLPGAPAAVRVIPADTAIYLNTTDVAHGAVLDRHGNVRPEQPSFAVRGGLPISGSSITGSAYGVYRVVGTAPGATPDSALLKVVPRGTMVATLSYSFSRIVAFDLDGSNFHNVELGPRTQVLGVAWTPDGTLVAGVRTTDSIPQLFSVTMDGKRTPLFAGSPVTTALRPVFSADGRWMYFLGADAAHGGEIWRSRADFTGLERVGSGSENVKNVAPSPDGSRVAYTVDTPDGPLRILDVAAGTSSAAIATGAQGVRWSPTGTRIAYSSPAGTTVVNVDGTGAQPVSAVPIYEGSPIWSPDGEWTATFGIGAVELVQRSTGLRIPLPASSGVSPQDWRP